MADLTPHMQAITDEFETTTAVNSLDRCQMRIRLIFDMFYDDEQGEPDQAIRDVITDLVHLTVEREVDFDEAVRRGKNMAHMESEEWAMIANAEEDSDD